MKNPASMHEDAGWIPGLAQWVKCPWVVVCVGRRGSSDLAWLWLWHRPAAAATAPIWSLARKLPYAAGAALKRPKKKKKFLNGQKFKWSEIYKIIRYSFVCVKSVRTEMFLFLNGKCDESSRKCLQTVEISSLDNTEFPHRIWTELTRGGNTVSLLKVGPCDLEPHWASWFSLFLTLSCQRALSNMEEKIGDVWFFWPFLTIVDENLYQL